MKVLKPDKLEELLVANWTCFLETGKLLAFVLDVVRRQSAGFCTVAQCKFDRKGVQMTVSRFHLTDNGFTLWADFSVPHEDHVAVGTTELHLAPSGTLTHVKTLGNLFVAEN